jgi:putative SOS response-associated peptidase YedK
MRNSDPKLPPDQQGKRSVIPFESHDFDRWLTCTVEEAKEMLKVPPVELFAARPVDEEDGSAEARVTPA